MSDDFVTQLNGARFLAKRALIAETIDVDPPLTYALPGSLTPIHRDRLQAHQADGLTAHEIVKYENARFLEANVRVRERHAAWVDRDYNARVQAQRELEEERQRREAEAAAAYHRRLEEILKERDAIDATADS